MKRMIVNESLLYKDSDLNVMFVKQKIHAESVNNVGPVCAGVFGLQTCIETMCLR